MFNVLRNQRACRKLKSSATVTPDRLIPWITGHVWPMAAWN